MTEPTLTQQAGPPIAQGSPKRRLKNYILDARFQLKFASYIVGLTLVVAGALGAFLYQTTSVLFHETTVAVEARSRAAETSKELGKVALTNELLQNMADPAFEKQLTERSEAIDRAYKSEESAIIAARDQLMQRQQFTLYALVGGLVGFVIFIGLASIVTTHKIVGPLFRVKRMAQEVADGKLRVPTYGLRPGDELKDLFDAFFAMVKALREREEEDLKHVESALRKADRTGASQDVVMELKALEAKVRKKLE